MAKYNGKYVLDHTSEELKELEETDWDAYLNVMFDIALEVLEQDRREEEKRMSKAREEQAKADKGKVLDTELAKALGPGEGDEGAGSSNVKPVK